MSDHEERFALAKQAYIDAFESWNDDLIACNGNGTCMRKVNSNLRALHTLMLQAANGWLGETGAAVEAAFTAARAAKKAIDDARARAADSTARMAATLDLIDSLKTLIDKAKAPKPKAEKTAKA